jgi:diaminopimelate epimerase
VRRAALVDLGNPHLVLDTDEASRDAARAWGPGLDQALGGCNVELVRVAGDGGLELHVWERGVGITEACGSGSCAAAWAAQGWGMVGASVVVHNPGGDVAVDLKDDRVQLTGPTQHVGRIELLWP